MTDLEKGRRAQGRLLSLLTHRRAGALLLALAMLLALTSIAVGFCTDDYSFRAALHSGRRSCLDLFRFSSGTLRGNHLLVTLGALPWWTAPDFKLHLIRPLTGALFALDDSVFGDRALGYHLHSLAWYLALLFAVSRICRRALPAGTSALAFLVYAFRGAHVLPYAWISARHVIIGATFAAFALLAHMKRTQEAWTPGRFLAPVLLLLGLSGSEVALAIVPFFISHDLAQGRASRQWKRALVRCAPAVIIAALYLVAYHEVGGGARSSAGYHDPFANPGEFAKVALTRIPTLLADALLGIPTSGLSSGPNPVVVVFGLVGLVLCAALFFGCRSISLEERAALAWLLPGALVALFISVAGLPGGRVLMIPDLGFAALLGVLLRHGFDRLGRSTLTRVACAGGTALLVLAHVVLAPLVSLREVLALRHVARATEAIARSVETGWPSAERIVLLAASDPFVFLYPKGILAEEAPESPRCWSVLSAARAPHRLTRTGERSFLLEPMGQPLLAGFDALFRSPDRPFAVGDEIPQCGTTVVVDAVDGGRPSRLRIALGDRPDSEDLALLVWQDHHLRRFTLPAIGETTELPWAPGPSRE